MPEGDTIFRTAATLRRWLGGREITAARVRAGHQALAADRLVGATVTTVESRGKHLLLRLSTGEVLHSHMGMTGSWHVYPAGEQWRRPGRQAQLVLEAGDRVAVCFHAPVIELMAARDESVHPSISRLGPDVLAEPFDLVAVRRRARLRAQSGEIRTAGELLLDQQVASGIGNVYRAEALFLCQVSPWTSIDNLDDHQLDELMLTAARLMRSNLAPNAPSVRRFGSQPGGPWVYRRAGRPCRKCGTAIRAQRLGRQPRTVYWCPSCQPDATPDDDRLGPSVPGRPPAAGRRDPAVWLQSRSVVEVEVATEVTDELVDAFRRLIPQLSKSAPPLGAEQLSEMVSAAGTTVLVARNATGAILGMLTLITFRIPTGVRAIIEDVVVDESARGAGVGGRLTTVALETAARAGARTVDLTSRPSREAANRLYLGLGFELRNTNVYRYSLESK